MGRPRGKTILSETASRTALAHNLPVLLAAKKWSVQSLANRSGVSIRAIRDAINLRHDTGLSKVDKMATALGLQGWQLLLEGTDVSTYRVIMEVLEMRRTRDTNEANPRHAIRQRNKTD